ncbi:hypothetical protein [Micromonospora sediminicola]|uniref:hypothetical protein n=1 Tax=Micromonospora sediminicola TaxID=946078 RepID=UPI003788986E
MTSQPYTNADVDQLTAYVRTVIGWPMSAGDVGTIVTAVLPALLEAGWLPGDGGGNLRDRCGHCLLLPSISGYVRAVQRGCPQHDGQAGAGGRE